MNMSTTAEGRSSPARADPSGRRVESRWKLSGRLVWLAYLTLYFAPWAFEKPSLREMTAGLIGTAVFLVLYADGLRSRPSYAAHAVVATGVGFALSGAVSPTATCLRSSAPSPTPS